jgi:signal transduction histidine kinase
LNITIVKYSEKNIDVNVFDKNDKTNIVIEDRGIGIPKEDQIHLFDRFFRAGNVGNIQGTGLGLNIVSRYCQLIDAGIRVESELNIGTKVYITLNNKSNVK